MKKILSNTVKNNSDQGVDFKKIDDRSSDLISDYKPANSPFYALLIHGKTTSDLVIFACLNSDFGTLEKSLEFASFHVCLVALL